MPKDFSASSAFKRRVFFVVALRPLCGALREFCSRCRITAARTARPRGSGAGRRAPRATEPGCGAEPHVSQKRGGRRHCMLSSAPAAPRAVLHVALHLASRSRWARGCARGRRFGMGNRARTVRADRPDGAVAHRGRAAAAPRCERRDAWDNRVAGCCPPRHHPRLKHFARHRGGQTTLRGRRHGAVGRRGRADRHHGVRRRRRAACVGRPRFRSSSRAHQRSCGAPGRAGRAGAAAHSRRAPQ